MFIEELIIEGFKSYATRTVISGWDPEFNAITGLNGSGKSNILDSICFVLGISTLSHVRATNLQDLVYKRGQAGITKASVTIVFNNEDRSKSPPGYENHKQLSVTRQIVVNGRNKYIVNGHNKNQQDVANLFQSVQLNVNNPHFLIMQGRITKVLNMKPPEILAMIEEAAGTRMFEDRKEKAFKTMAKKDAKLDEITQLLLTEIEPKLEKLRESKRTFLEFKKLAADLDQLCRWQVALEYMKYEAKLEASGQDLQEKEERLVTLDEMQKTVGEELQVIDRQIAQIAAARENDSSQLKSLENTYKEKSKDLIRIKTQCDLKASTVVEERKNWDGLLKEKLETEQALEASKAKYQKLSTNYEATLNSHRDQTEEVRRKEELVQSLSTGLATNDGQDSGYQGQLQEANKAISTANSAAEQAKLKINHLKKELHAKMPKAKAAEKQNSSLVAELRSNEKIVAMLENELQGLMRDPDRAQDLLRQKQAAQATVNSLRQQVESLERELSSFQFSYSDPVPNFDRRKVKGLVAELVNIPKQNEGAAAALEVCAGGRLYNVVVDTEVVGSQLLQHGRLRRRVTIIPLNKISTFRVQAERIATARKVAPGKCDLALNLVGYAEDVERAMNYVFGSTLICNDSDTAKKVTFDKNVRLRSITLEGDTYDPSGQLSGGSRANSAGNLLKLSTLNECRHKLAEHEKELVTITQLLEECERTESHYGGLEQKLGLKRHEGALLKERLSTNSNAQVIRQVEELVQELNQQEELRQQATEKKAEATERRTKIEQEMKEFTLHRDDKLKSMQKEIASSRAKLAKAEPSIANAQQELDVCKGESLELEKEVETMIDQISRLEQTIAEIETEDARMREELALVKKEFDRAEAALQSERQTLSAFDTETKALDAQKREKKQLLEDYTLNAQKLRHELEKFESDREHASRKVAELLTQNPWIPHQKQLFGKPGTDYDFAKSDVAEVKRRIADLEKQRKALERKLDHNVMDKFDRVEKKEVTLRQMLSTVQRDKRKIQETIQELDKYKREALQKTWEKVNVDFGAIFADLLPGNWSKLEPPAGQDIFDGLEVKVALGGVWKQSLTELSGGQRSLIALSLILSLLQYKPAPMYILDEVDSALDLSHTQNIGQLIRTRFKGSQFIIVSLKDGMFNNANVLFKTKFREGVSTVERTSQRDRERSGGKSVSKARATPGSALTARAVRA